MDPRQHIPSYRIHFIRRLLVHIRCNSGSWIRSLRFIRNRSGQPSFWNEPNLLRFIRLLPCCDVHALLRILRCSTQDKYCVLPHLLDADSML